MRQTSRWLAGLVAAGATAFALAGAVPADAATRSHTVYVAPHGAAGNADRSCRTARYRSINRAIAAASRGGTVIVCRGGTGPRR